MRTALRSAALLTFLLVGPMAVAADLPLTGAAPIEHEFAPPLQLDPTQTLIISGENRSSQPAPLTVRADDSKSAGYDSRINEAHTVGPGPFSLEIPLSGWKTPSGRPLDLADIRRIILFDPDGGNSPFVVSKAVTVAANAAPSVAPLGPPPAKITLPLSGPTKVGHDFSPPLRLDPRQEFLIVGENRSGKSVTLVMRVDDGKSTSYSTRINEERILPPGPFRVRSSPGEWKTPAGQKLDFTDIRRVILFTLDGDPAVDIASVTAETSFALPQGAVAWKFGPAGSAVFPGFEAVAAGDKRITGGSQVGIVRPNADGLIGSGLRGVERFDAPLANGRWTISLWTEDPGEWEFLPHELQRTITVNGHIALNYKLTPDQWVRNVYMAGREGEAIADGDPWQLFGRRRGGLVSLDVDVTDGHLSIQQKGEGLEASFLSGALAEPANDNHRALAAVEAARRERFLDRWPVLPFETGAAVPNGLSLGLLPENAPVQLNWRPPAASPAVVPSRSVARGGLVMLNFMALSDHEEKRPTITVSAPVLDGKALSGDLRWGQWRFRRPGPSANALVVQADHLRGDMEAVSLRAGLPRPLNLLIRIPERAAPGHYAGSIQVVAGGVTRSQAFEIEVLPNVLPEIQQPIGVYLEDPPFYEWFNVPDADRDRANQCDLSFLSELGLTELAAPLVTPTVDHIARFISQLDQLHDSGFPGPPLAYQQIKRLVEQFGIDGIGPPLTALDRTLRLRHLEPPIWSIADEPGNPGSMPDDLAHLRRILQGAMPGAKIAGHLNHKDDRSLLPLFDIALINTGFGVDADEFASIRAKGVVPWIYNMPNIETAAGFYLWRANAGGYLQWHGRLPTADPFDPTDGREDDVMLLPVTGQPCLAVPDVDIHLLRMARGIDDLRWMTWLQARAGTDKTAADLVNKIRQGVPGTWTGDDDGIDLGALRASLILFARNLR